MQGQDYGVSSEIAWGSFRCAWMTFYHSKSQFLPTFRKALGPDRHLWMEQKRVIDLIIEPRFWYAIGMSVGKLVV